MSNAYEIYVISNSGLFREGLNAVAAFCNSDGFHAATYMGALIGIVFTAVSYVKQHDVMLYLKWLAVYFFVFNVLLGVTQTVAIINTSDSSMPAQIVDNVPLGIALPAHIITAFGYDFSNDLEVAFNTPDALQYHKTGMLFGSNLFQLSLASQLDDASVMNEMNQYVRACVVGDILINHKYTIDDLLNSKDIWALMSKNPSPVRGIFIKDKFNTCAQATTDLSHKINNFVTSKAPGILSKFIPSHHAYSKVAINNYLSQSYQALQGLSDSASNILRQNITINAFRSGIINYAAETGAVAGMQNFANTVAMQNTRLAWATSSHMGVQTLPLTQVVLLLTMLCLFPLIAVLTLIPNIGFSVFKNYIYTLLWLESWPIMFTVLNMAMNYYLSPGVTGSVHPVTLSNINRLAQEHSDIAGVAGYLILAIPFLSIGIVKGMASTFNQAAQYLGGMMHSIGQSAASSVAMGNYNLGNVSTGNATANMLSANKHDTNFTDMHGLSTEQLANATTVTTTASGAILSNNASGSSHIGTSINASAGISEALSHSADKYMTSAMNNRASRDHSLSSASSNALSFDDSTANAQSLSTTDSNSQTAQAIQALSDSRAIATRVASGKQGDVGGAYATLSQNGLNEQIGVDSSKSVLGKVGGVLTGISGSAQGRSVQQQQKDHSEHYKTSDDYSITADQQKRFNHDQSVLSNYAKTHSATSNSNSAAALASKVGSDYRQALSASKSMMADLTTGERLGQQASITSSNSGTVNTDFTQAFTDHVRDTHSYADANRILNGMSSQSIMQRQTLAENYLQQYTKSIEDKYIAESSQIHPNKNFQKVASGIEETQAAMHQNYESHENSIASQSKNAGVHFNKKAYQAEVQHTDQAISIAESKVHLGKKDIIEKANNDNQSVHKNLEKHSQAVKKGLWDRDF